MTAADLQQQVTAQQQATANQQASAQQQVTADQLFTAERSNLMAVAYRLLGTMSDAEDVLQDVFEKWLRADRSSIQNPAAYLTTMTTRAGIDRLRSAQVKREVYVGPWLPEPIPTPDDDGSNPADVAVLDESLTIGYLYLLEQLTPVERACFLLHDVFDYSYREIAGMVGKDEVNCRQLASRSRNKLKARKANPLDAPVPEVESELTDRLIGAVLGGDIGEVMALMTEDVVHLSDGGKDHRAARQPVVGPDRVARLLVNLAARLPQPDEGALEIRRLRVNKQPAILVVVDDNPVTVVIVEHAGDLVRRVHAVVNPEKLHSLTSEAFSGPAR